VASKSVNSESGASRPRSVDSELPTEPGPEQPEASGDDLVGRITQEFHQAVAIGDELIGSLKNYSELLGLELALAVKSLPALLGSWLLLLPAVLLSWVSFSLLLAWVGYSVSGVPLVGFLVLFAMQITLLLLLWFSVKRYRRRLTLPESRQQLKTFVEDIRDEFSKPNTTKKPRAEPAQEKAE